MLVSVHVFGMKLLWDIHFLLLTLLCLLGAVTSQVNPSTYHHNTANATIHFSGFGCLYLSPRLQWYHIQQFVKTLKCHLWVLSKALGFGAAVQQSRLQLIQILDKCCFVGAKWSPLSGLASLIPACTPFSSSPYTAQRFLWCQWKGTYYVLQGNRVATFGGQRQSQIEINEL